MAFACEKRRSRRRGKDPASAKRGRRIRNGAVNLFAAFDVSNGKMASAFTEKKGRAEFLERMAATAGMCPEDRELHMVRDNCRIRRKAGERPAARPNFSSHFTPAPAPRMNAAEARFGLLAGKALKAAASRTAGAGAGGHGLHNRFQRTGGAGEAEEARGQGSRLRNAVTNLFG